jgi:hypothetical protein
VNFNVKYNSSLKNPQGNVVITVYSLNNWRTGLPDRTADNPHVYRIKSNAISVLAVDQIKKTAQFTSKGNIAEVIGNSETSIEGNISIQIDVTDNYCGNNLDRIAVTVHKSKGGGIWYSDSWDGAKSVEKEIVAGSGEISIVPCTPNPIANRVATQSRVPEVKLAPTPTLNFDLKAYPNPTTTHFNVKLESSNITQPMTLNVVDVSGKIIEVRKNLVAGQTFQLGANYRPGMYFVELIQGDTRRIVKLVKQPD